ncbi:hypothetical protein SD81_034650 [Tolypothrix campylonemoides VB511288]|nr:hypothetical protein SD81_034650 [Tolypothrix campylonemoides VB511288]
MFVVFGAMSMSKRFNALLKNFFSFLVILLASVSLLTAVPSVALAQGLNEIGDLVFYEGNNCTQDIVFTYNSEKAANDNC